MASGLRRAAPGRRLVILQRVAYGLGQRRHLVGCGHSPIARSARECFLINCGDERPGLCPGACASGLMYDRPRDGRCAQSSAGRIALLVREVDDRMQFRTLLSGYAHEVRLEVRQHHLRASEEVEVTVLIDGAPVEIKEPVAARSLHQRSPIVEGTACLGDGPHLDLPGRGRCVASKELLGLPTIADTNVYVLVRDGAGSRRAVDAGEVPAVDLDDHQPDCRRSLWAVA